MQKSFIQHLFTVSILSCCLLFGGCSQNSAGDDTSSATTASTSPSETVTALPADVSPDSDTSAIESTSEDTRALTLSVVNMCGIEVGMVAVIRSRDRGTGKSGFPVGSGIDLYGSRLALLCQ